MWNRAERGEGERERDQEIREAKAMPIFAEAERHKGSASNLSFSGARQRPPLPPFEGRLQGHGYSRLVSLLTYTLHYTKMGN